MDPAPDILMCHLCDRPASVILRQVPACSSHAVRHLTLRRSSDAGDPAEETVSTAGPDNWIGANLASPPATGVTTTSEASPTSFRQDAGGSAAGPPP